MIYLDNSATTRTYDEVNKAMLAALEEDFGNPSSLHRLGLAAEKKVKAARAEVARALGVPADCLFFTACGTEADNTALLGAARAKRRTGRRIITTAVEHPAVLEPCKRLEADGYEVVYLGVDNEGFVSAKQVQDALTEDTIIVSIMAVNNESGCIMPIEEIGRVIAGYNKEHGTEILFHSDMVQSFGKVRFNMELVDMASVSAHKIHGPKGIGALYIKKGVHIEPLLLGGGQEQHFRSGTENVASIVGFGRAAQLGTERFDARTKTMENAKMRLLEGIQSRIKDIRVNTPGHDSVCSVLNISFLNTRGEVILHTLEQSEVYVSTGSACASNHASKGGSHVLRAMGLSPKEVEGAIRFSFSEFNTLEDIDAALDAVEAAVTKFRKLGSFR